MLHARKDYNRRIQDIEKGIGKDEPVFLLRGQDELMLPMLQHYLMLLRNGTRPCDKVIEAAVVGHIATLLRWRFTHEVVAPDMPAAELCS